LDNGPIKDERETLISFTQWWCHYTADMDEKGTSHSEWENSSHCTGNSGTAFNRYDYGSTIEIQDMQFNQSKTPNPVQSWKTCHPKRSTEPCCCMVSPSTTTPWYKKSRRHSLLCDALERDAKYHLNTCQKVSQTWNLLLPNPYEVVCVDLTGQYILKGKDKHRPNWFVLQWSHQQPVDSQSLSCWVSKLSSLDILMGTKRRKCTNAHK
jgi:hypothetical protein